jgi:predicted dehydrogenase
MEKLKAIVVGVGHLGKEHARIYSELSDRIQLVGLLDTNFDRASKLAHRLRTRAFSNLAELPADIDLASVAVPTIYHFDVAKSLLERGIHTLVEKPIAPTIQEASALVDLARSKQLILQVGHVERYNPAYQALENVLNGPRFIECLRLSPFPERGTDVGVVLDLMIHDIDIILQLTGSPVREIKAVGVPVLSAYEDIANARLEFENGCIANLTTSRISMEKLRKIRIFQQNAYISLDYFKQEGKIYRKENGKIVWDHIPFKKAEPLKIEIDSFIDCVVHAKDPVVSGEHGKDALEVAMEVLHVIQKSSPS